VRFRLFALSAVIVLVWILSFSSNPRSAFPILLDWMHHAAPLALLSLAAGIVISCGQIDLAAGAAFAAFGMLLVIGRVLWGSSPVAALGTLCLSIVALLLLYFAMYSLTIIARIPSLLTSLGMSYCCMGLSLLLKGIVDGRDESTTIAIDSFRPVIGHPTVTVCVITGLLVAWRSRTISGLRHVAVGMDAVAANVAGVNSSVVYARAFIAAGFLVALSSLTFAVNISNGGWGPNLGWGKELFAIAAAVVGGCKIKGGSFNPVGIVFGALLVTVVHESAGAFSLPAALELAILGAGLLIVGLADYWSAHANAGRGNILRWALQNSTFGERQ
jgi:ribose/xylose/arabinose/galactoside ABC-type transport system permease subunit